MTDYKMLQADKNKDAKKKEMSFALEAYDLLKRGFALKGMDISPFCSQKSGFVKSIVSVKAGGSLAGQDGIRFADGILYVGRKVYDKFLNDPAGFAARAAEAVLDGLEEQARWKKGYTVPEQDRAYLTRLRDQFRAGGLDKKAVPAQTKGEKMVELEGSVVIPEWMHKLYQSMRQPPGHFLNEQAFAAGYSEYLRGVKAGDIKAGIFIIADFNLHVSQPRFYKMDFSDAAHPRILDSIKVEHGITSDADRDGWVNSLSNVDESHASSQGLYVIAMADRNQKFGGLFWRLEGKASTSSRAWQRGILIHRKSGGYTWGCFGLDIEAAGMFGLPLNGNMAGTNAQEQKKKTDEWLGVGVFVYYDPLVQKVCKKYWPVEKK